MAIRMEACRICGSRTLEDILSLGDLPPVNSFLSGPEQFPSEKKHPLAIAFCAGCTHVQLTHRLDPRDIFEDYIYFSSMSETVVRWGEALARRYADELALGPDDLVGELASNDGCILRPFKARSQVQGVEPAKNIAEVANREGIPTRVEFFDSRLGRSLRQELGPAKLLIARNVVAHVPEVVDFISGAREWLADGGVLHVEVPYLRPMVEHVEFDTIYHEHLSYFSVTSLDRLFREAGLKLWDVEEISLHGGSLIARGRAADKARPSVARYLDAERAAGLHTPAPLHAFARRTRALKTAIPEFLDGLSRDGARVAAYGAAAKGVVLTNYCGLGPETLSFVADRSPYKQGKLTPGMHLPVVPPQAVMERRPEYLLVLAWNFFDEIARQLDAYERGGGKFVLPVPKPQVTPGARS
ncbi:MAG TPA: class I SAM-dependent methyltransferase [Myxococcales bacterium]|nr:class I SAM-dependent methyltransferase [Myxococcales bacterium]